jgi:N-acetylmuramoyl-L-alanine amidase
VHYNASHNPSARGIEVFYYPPHAPHDATRSRASKSLAQTVLSSLLKTTSASSRGIKDANYAVLRQTQMPAILVEGGFLSNPDEKAQLLDPVYLKSIALAIAQGIDQYVQQVRS